MAESPQHPGKIMETETRFNLSQAVGIWRRHMASTTELDADSLRELEHHLLDSTARLQQCGLQESEAFLIARRRLGTPARLDEEYRCADPGGVWRTRIPWMIAGALIMSLWGQVTSLIWRIALTDPWYSRAPGRFSFRDPAIQLLIPIAQTLLYSTPMIVGFLLARGYLTAMADRMNPLFSSRRKALMVLLTGSLVIFGGSWFQQLYAASPAVPYEPATFWTHIAVMVGTSITPGICMAILITWLMPNLKKSSEAT